MKKLSFTQRILENNYAILIISVVISITIWVYMSMNAGNDTNVTISNIPIQIDLSDSARELGLEVFVDSEPTASVTVTGNRTILGMVDASDLSVTAAASSINSTGNFTLPISVTKSTNSKNFQITNSTPSSVNVYVDYFKENNFPIQDGIVLNVKEGYYATTSLPYNQITVSGPQNEISKIRKVTAKAEVNRELTESIDVDADIILYDENDNELSTQLLTLSVEKLTANINVLPEKTVKLSPVFINKPPGLKLTKDLITVTPSEILIAGSEDVLDKIESVNLEPIDFSTLQNQSVTFDDLSVELPDKCKNISNSSTASIKLDLSGFAKKKFTVDNFTVDGLSDDYTSEVTSKNISVTVIGPEEEISNLDADSITAVIDTSGTTKTGSVEMPVTFKFEGTDSCWYYGTYQANLTITER